MRRRDFMSLLGAAAAATSRPWPLAARAQQPAMPVIGYLDGGSREPRRAMVAAFHQGLGEAGYVEGRNVAIEYRFAEGQYDRLPAPAAELAGRPVAVIVATGGVQSALAAKAASTTIPIVFLSGVDPVRAGLVASLNRPGGNVTGLTFLTSQLEAKWLGLLHELVPQAGAIAALVNANYAAAASQSKDVREAAASLGVRPIVLDANADRDFDTAFATLARERADALLVCASPFFNSRREQLVALSARHAIPAIYELREFAVAGGLASYGTNVTDAYRQLGLYAGRILKGEKPTDLPVQQSTRFEFVINLKTAKALGLPVPRSLLALADEVIE